MKIKILLPIVLTSLLAAVTGCASLPTWLEGEQARPLLTPVNFRGDAQLAPDIQRIALLPLHGGEAASAEITAALDPVLLTTLQRQMRFEVVVVSREDCAHLFGAGDFASTAALPHGFLEKLAEKYAVDAVLFTDLTVLHAYRPLTLGLRAKLATVRDVRLIWAFDEVFSAADDKMVNSVRQFNREGDRLAPVDSTPRRAPEPDALRRRGCRDHVSHPAPPIMGRTLPSALPIFPLKSAPRATIITLSLNGVPCNNSQRLTVLLNESP